MDDNPADIYLIREAISAARPDAQITTASDGECAARFFDEADLDPSNPCPSLVILDINLPKKRGGEVLQHLRRSPRCHDVPVIAVSTSDAPKDREEMMSRGANDYFHKPSRYDDFMKLSAVIRRLLPPKPRP